MAPWTLPPPTVCTNIGFLGKGFSKLLKNLLPIPLYIYTIKYVQINIGSAITKKHDNPMHIKSNALQHVDMHYQGFQRIYTDGSKEPTSRKTGAAIYDPSGPFEEGYRCTDNISVYSTEMIALIAALKHIHNKGYQRTVVLSDSLSALQTLQTSRPTQHNPHPLTLNHTMQPTYTIPLDTFTCRHSR
jgi:hypothetical protein